MNHIRQHVTCCMLKFTKSYLHYSLNCSNRRKSTFSSMLESVEDPEYWLSSTTTALKKVFFDDHLDIEFRKKSSI